MENAKPEAIREALSKLKSDKKTEEAAGGVTQEMFSEAGLEGFDGARERREKLADHLGLAYGNAKALYSRITAFGITAGEFNEALRAIDNKTDKE